MGSWAVAVVLMLVLIIPITTYVTMLFYYRQPYIGSMYAALQVLVLAGGKLLVGHLETTLDLKGSVGAVDLTNSAVKMSTGGSELTSLGLLGAAVMVFAIAAFFQRDKERMAEVFARLPKRRRRQG